MHGYENNQFYLRDMQKCKANDTVEGSLFDGHAFFSDSKETRVKSMTLLTDRDSNYLRLFDSVGNRLMLD